MDSKQVRNIMEAYVSVYQEKKEVEQLDENVQDAVKGALEKGANFMKTNPVGKAVSKIIAPVGGGRKTPTATSGGYRKEEIDLFDAILEHLVAEGYADTNESALAIMANMSEEWREEILEGLVDALASGAGTVVGTAQRAAREIPKYVQQKVKNVAGTYEYARQRADANAPSGKMTTNPRSREFSHGNQGGKPAPMKPMKTMRNPGPNFGRG